MFKRIADTIPLAATLAAVAAILLLPNAVRGAEVGGKSWGEATSEPAPIALITVHYSVFILSCSVNRPDNCTKQYVGDIKTPTSIGCLMGAQPLMRKWIEDHAAVRAFKNLRCVDSRRKDYELGRGQA